MARYKLTAATIKAAKPGTRWDGAIVGKLYNDGGGLYLHVGEGKSWVFRYVSPATGRTRDFGMGSLDDISLADARDILIQLRKLVRDGRDPIEERRIARAARAGAAVVASKVMTFSQCAEAAIVAQRPAWSENGGSEAQWRQSLATYAFPVLGDLPVGEIETIDVERVLATVWVTSPSTARRLAGRIEKVLARATALKLRQGENPARWKGHLENLFTIQVKDEIEHRKALPYASLPGIMAKLRGIDSVAARVLEFCILVNARPGEVIGNNHGKPPMVWGEVDMENRMWTVPGSGPRKYKSHIWRVPLSDRAMAILAEMGPAGADAPVFPGASLKAPLKLLRTLAGDFEVTVHGSDRSTFSDWAAEEHASIPEETRKLAVGHWINDKVDQAYRRGDGLTSRRRLAQLWADFCAGRTSDNVVELRRA